MQQIGFLVLLLCLLLLILAAIVAYWIMQLAAPRPAIAPSGALGEAATTRSLNSAALAFGRPQGPQPVVATPTNIQVFGVAESGENGVAILAVDGKAPRTVLVVTVERCYFQCARAIVRSHLWDASHHVAPSDVPTPGQVLQRTSQGEIDARIYDAEWPGRAAKSMW